MSSGVYIRVKREKWESVELEDLKTWEVLDALIGKEKKELEDIIQRLLAVGKCPICSGKLVANEYECSACGELFLPGDADE